MQNIIISILAAITLFALPLSAQEPALPDFSKGMPDVPLNRAGTVDGQKAFFLNTANTSKEFSATLVRFIGAGWVKRKITPLEMAYVAFMGRTSNSAVNYEAYRNEKFHKVEIIAGHIKQKQSNAKASVEISISPRKRLESFLD